MRIDGSGTLRANCVLCPNPGPMTLDGTNTWVLRGPGSDEVVVVDPGPDDAEHIVRVAAVVAVSVPGEWHYRGTAAMRTLHRLILTRAGRTLLRLARRTRVSPAGWSDKDPIDARAAAAEVDVPMLVVHGDEDDYFPLHHAWHVHSAAADAALWLERGLGHAEAGVTEALVRRIGTWLDSHTKAAEGERSS